MSSMMAGGVGSLRAASCPVTSGMDGEYDDVDVPDVPNNLDGLNPKP